MKQTGLTTAQAIELLEKHGKNMLVEKKKSGKFARFLSQLSSPLVIILCIAAIISIALHDWLEGVLIFAIVLANAVLGFIQENKAENALAALKQMTVTLTRVMRDGKIQEVDSRELVPGDIILLEEGNKIPADAKLLESVHFEVNESALTGESMPVEKHVDNPDSETIYMGTVATKGRATAIVTATGMNTRFGLIAKHLTEIQKEETSLEKKLHTVGKLIGLLALAAAIIIFFIGLAKNEPVIKLFLTGVSLAVAAVPEGLPAVITITLAMGVQRMAKKHAIMRKLDAIESVGGITVIATDKTGTLTKNEMHAVKFWIAGRQYDSGKPVGTKEKKIFDHMLRAGVLCNTASLNDGSSDNPSAVIGDQTEGALLLFAKAYGVDIQAMRSVHPLADEFSFDATTKTMSVLVQKGTTVEVLAKGAPEAILSRSKRYYSSSGEKELTKKEAEIITKSYEEFAKLGLRTIAIATKSTKTKIRKRDQAESDLTYIGLVGIADPIRQEVPQAIKRAQKAGIRTIMVTGDNPLTATTIGREIGLVTDGSEVITGDQFENLTDEQMRQKLENVRVFARTTPEQKLRIVRLLQLQGHTVAVTGDGVNDSLALKQADVGVSMGKIGTDVAREASDMIITDDNYATLIDAVEEGRGIYDNMKASIKYLLGCNLGEILAILGGAMLGWPIILTPLQILYMNLATDGLQAIALAMNPKSSTIMDRQPHEPGKLFFTHDRYWLFEVSILTALITLIAFGIGYSFGSILLGQSLAFTAIVLCQQFVYLDIASVGHSVFTPRLWKNRWMLLPIITAVVQVGFMYFAPTQNIFKITAPSVQLTFLAVFIPAGILLFSEFRKRIGKGLGVAVG